MKINYGKFFLRDRDPSLAIADSNAECFNACLLELQTYLCLTLLTCTCNVQSPVNFVSQLLLLVQKINISKHL